MHDEIRNYHTSSIDGAVIANMLQFVYLCPCFKENELIELQIGDIQYQDRQIVDVIIKDGNGTIVNDAITNRGGIWAKNLIREHIEYLKSKGYRATENSPLFPGKRPCHFCGTTNHENVLEIVVHGILLYPNSQKEAGRFLFGGINPEW